MIYVALLVLLFAPSAPAEEFLCQRFGFSLDVPEDLYRPARGDSEWMRFEARDGSGASLELAGMENFYYPLEEFVIYRIKPGMTILKAEKSYHEPEEEPQYDLYELAYEYNGFT